MMGMVKKIERKTEGGKLETKEKEKTETGGGELVEEKQEGKQVKGKGGPKTITGKMLDLMEGHVKFRGVISGA